MIRQVEWPLALPLVISGCAAPPSGGGHGTVAAFVAGGGLGRLLITGQADNYPQMFAGAFLDRAMAIMLDLLLGLVAWLAARRARRGSGRALSRWRPPRPLGLSRFSPTLDGIR